MARIEILLEERSMKELLEVLLPRILPDGWVLNQNYFLHPHEGKQDLQKSIPKKMQVFSKYYEPAGIVVLQDKDSSDCKILKQKLIDCCKTVENPCPFLVRIACHELEAWYLGDFDAVEAAYPNCGIEKQRTKAKYRKPDEVANAAEEIKKIIPQFQKIAGAKAIAPYLHLEKNKSDSFLCFVSGIQKFFSQFNPV